MMNAGSKTPAEDVTVLLRRFANTDNFPGLYAVHDPRTRVTLLATILGAADLVDDLRAQLVSSRHAEDHANARAAESERVLEAVADYLDVPDHLSNENFVAFKTDIRGFIAGRAARTEAGA